MNDGLLDINEHGCNDHGRKMMLQQASNDG